MKKITALLLTVLMVVSMFTFVGCQKKPASELVPDAFKKTSKLDSFDIDYKFSVEASSMGMGIEVPVSGKLQVAGIDDIDDFELYASFEVDLSDVESVLSAYGVYEDLSDPVEGEIAYADGWLYVKYNLMGEEGEAKADVSYYIDIIAEELEDLDMDAVMDQMIPSDVQIPSEVTYALGLVKDMFEELLDEADVKTKKGNSVVTLKIDEDEINDMIDGVMSYIGADFDFSVEELSSVITINSKEYIVGFATKLEVSAEASGIKADVKAKFEFTLNDPGSKVKVKTIKGSKNFEEVDADDLLG